MTEDINDLMRYLIRAKFRIDMLEKRLELLEQRESLRAEGMKHPEVKSSLTNTEVMTTVTESEQPAIKN